MFRPNAGKKGLADRIFRRFTAHWPARKPRKGYFITTSFFSSQARDFVKSVEGIVLIDGARLTELMMDYEVGISARTIKIPKVDTDYFDEEAT